VFTGSGLTFDISAKKKGKRKKEKMGAGLTFQYSGLNWPVPRPQLTEGAANLNPASQKEPGVFCGCYN